MTSDQKLELELIQQRFFFIGFLEGLLCYTENGADPSKVIKEMITKLEHNPEGV